MAKTSYSAKKHISYDLVAEVHSGYEQNWKMAAANGTGMYAQVTGIAVFSIILYMFITNYLHLH
jgi:hypothetical protein